MVRYFTSSFQNILHLGSDLDLKAQPKPAPEQPQKVTAPAQEGPKMAATGSAPSEQNLIDGDRAAGHFDNH